MLQHTSQRATWALLPLLLVVFAGLIPAELVAQGNSDAYILTIGEGRAAKNDSAADSERVEGLRSQSGGDVLWFRHGGKEYWVKDAATVKEAQGYFAPQADLSKQQADLGKRQQDLSAQQADLSKKQEELGKTGGGEQAKELSDLSHQQSALDDQMSEVSMQQKQVSDKQRAQSLEAEGRLSSLISRAIASGAAQAVS